MPYIGLIDGVGASNLQTQITALATQKPCFSAYQSVAQTSFPANTSTKVNFQTVAFDDLNAYDETNMKFQPTVAGYYHIIGCVGVLTTSCGIAVKIYKNGTSVHNGNYPTASSWSNNTSGVVYLNGTTDYVEIWANITSSQSLKADNTFTTFQAFYIMGVN